MNHQRILIVILLFFTVEKVYSQQYEMDHLNEFNNFSGLSSAGQVPEDFTVLSTTKFEEDYLNNKDASLDKEFFISTRFFIDELLLSGLMLFNEPVSKYLNEVADIVLKSEPDLRKKLRFYVLKSNAVNAFSTDQGVIVFTTGLFAKLENEAQLAFILAHEVSHFTHHHVRKGYVRFDEINSDSKYRRKSYDAKIKELSKYNRENELEADEAGIELILKSGYAPAEILSAFNMLLYAELPHDDIVFDTSFFNSGNFQVPGCYFPDEVTPIRIDASYDDETSSHPNIFKRTEKAAAIINSANLSSGEKFILGEDQFKYIRNLARFETVYLQNANREYGDAIYSNFLLRKEFKSNRFLDLSLVKSLYGLVKYKNCGRDRYKEVAVVPANASGESQALHIFLSRITKQQLNTISMRIAFEMERKYPNDAIFELYLKDMKFELIKRGGISWLAYKDIDFITGFESKFSTTYGFNLKDSITKIANSTLVDSIKQMKMLQLDSIKKVVLGRVESEFHLYGMYDYITPDFKSDFEKNHENSDDQYGTKLDAVSLNDKSARPSIKKLVIVNPIVEVIRMHDKTNPVKAEEQKVRLAEMYNQDYSKLNLETYLIDSKNLTDADVSEYNELGLLNIWLNEILAHDGVSMISSTHDQVEKISEKYGTDHYYFSGIYLSKGKEPFSKKHTLLFMFAWPWVIYDVVRIHSYVDIVSLVIKGENESIEFADLVSAEVNGSGYIVSNYIYDILYRISSNK